MIDWSSPSLIAYDQSLEHFRAAIGLAYPSGISQGGSGNGPTTPASRTQSSIQEAISRKMVIDNIKARDQGSAVSRERSVDSGRNLVNSYSAIHSAKKAMSPGRDSKAETFSSARLLTLKMIAADAIDGSSRDISSVPLHTHFKALSEVTDTIKQSPQGSSPRVTVVVNVDVM